MPIKVRCPNPACGKSASISDDHVGRTLRCGNCGEKFTAASLIEEPGSPGTGVKARPSTVIGKVRASTANGISPSHDQAADDHRKSAASKGVGDGPKQIGRFQIRARVGAGAFGTVFRAYDPQLDREVALKVPHTVSLDSSKAVERFLREAKAAAQLRHPHIVPMNARERENETEMGRGETGVLHPGAPI
jgi:hypothetical protein